MAGGSRPCLLFLVLPAGLLDKDEVRQHTWEDEWKFRSTFLGGFPIRLASFRQLDSKGPHWPTKGAAPAEAPAHLSIPKNM